MCTINIALAVAVHEQMIEKLQSQNHWPAENVGFTERLAQNISRVAHLIEISVLALSKSGRKQPFQEQAKTAAEEVKTLIKKNIAAEAVLVRFDITGTILGNSEVVTVPTACMVIRNNNEAEASTNFEYTYKKIETISTSEKVRINFRFLQLRYT